METPVGFIGRARAALPGRKPPAKKGVVSSLGSAKDSALARKPSKKAILGIVATAGFGAAAMAKRHRDASTDGVAAYPPVQSAEAHTEQSTAEAHTEQSTAEARTEQSTAEAHNEESSSTAA